VSGRDLPLPIVRPRRPPRRFVREIKRDGAEVPTGKPEA
jgi:hypothetical protein